MTDATGRAPDEVGLPTAQRLMAEGRWADAHLVLTSIGAADVTADVLAALGTTAWWLGQPRAGVRFRERAFAAYVAEEALPDAVLVAVDICVTYLSSLDEPAVAQGWLGRARRVARRSGDDRAQAWVALVEGWSTDHPEQARQALEYALTVARERGDPDLELAALADLGLALVRAGEVGHGLALLDEAAAGSLAGQGRRPDTVVWTCCSMLAACSIVEDHRRAAQWCSAAEDFALRYGCPFLLARCQAHYGRVLVVAGDWERAESALSAALSGAASLGSEPRGEAAVGLALLRLRQGDLDAAEDLLWHACADRTDVLVAAELLTARGRGGAAATLIEGSLHDPRTAMVDRPRLLAGLVDAHLTTGDLPAARRALEELVDRPIPGLTGLGHPEAAAASARARGRVAAADCDDDQAAWWLGTAAREYDELGQPYAAARSRRELAEAVAVSNPGLAMLEARRALAAFERMGAAPDVDRTAALLRRLGIPTRGALPGSPPLTDRERAVLERLRRGLTNPQIAAELYISPRTVGHHVSSILAKLGAANRTEAVTLAGRADPQGGRGPARGPAT